MKNKETIGGEKCPICKQDNVGKTCYSVHIECFQLLKSQRQEIIKILEGEKKDYFPKNNVPNYILCYNQALKDAIKEIKDL